MNDQVSTHPSRDAHRSAHASRRVVDHPPPDPRRVVVRDAPVPRRAAHRSAPDPAASWIIHRAEFFPRRLVLERAAVLRPDDVAAPEPPQQTKDHTMMPSSALTTTGTTTTARTGELGGVSSV